MGIVEQFKEHLTKQPNKALLSTNVQKAIELTLDAQSQQLAKNKNNWKARYPKKADENATATKERLAFFSQLGESLARLAQHVKTKYQQSLSPSQTDLDRYISRHRDDEQATFAAYTRQLTTRVPTRPSTTGAGARTSNGTEARASAGAGAGAGARAATTDHHIETLTLGQGDQAIIVTAIYSTSLAIAMAIYNDNQRQQQACVSEDPDSTSIEDEPSSTSPRP